MIKVRRKIQFATRERGRQVLTDAPARVEEVRPVRIPRIARLMALAIHLDRLIREGKVKGLTELARLTHVTQPRLTQILNLNHLAPDVQEQLLFLPRRSTGRERVHERGLRFVAAHIEWSAQRRLFASLARHD